MSDIFNPLIPVVDALEQLGIPYYIGGSIASSAYGLPRSTIDIDIIADVRMEHARLLANILQGAYYADEDMMKDAVRHRSEFNLIHHKTSIKLDIFLPKRRPFDVQTAQRVREEQLDEALPERTFRLESPEDVILSKLEWYKMGGEVSERQWKDIQGVLKVQGPRLDLAYLRHWAGEIGVASLLTKALQEAGFA